MEPDLLVFDNSIIENHIFYSLCGDTLSMVSKKDYEHTDYFNPKIKCLDMDNYEKKILKTSHADNTMDAAIGVANYVNNKKTKNRLLLVELRMGYKSCKNLSKENIRGKIKHTRDLLVESFIDETNYFIFTKDQVSEAEWWFNRESLNNNIFGKYRICSVEGFDEDIQDPDNMPYVPIYSKEIIIESIAIHEEKNEWELFFKQIKYWCEKAVSIKYKRPHEYSHLKLVLQNYWKSFKSKNYNLDDNSLIDLEIVEEDYGLILFDFN